MTIKELMDQDKSLKVGTKVRVYWGYGLGFRAKGIGTITKLYDKSVRVRLDEPAYLGKSCWPAGYELKGIPRYSVLECKWHPDNRVVPIEARQ